MRVIFLMILAGCGAVGGAPTKKSTTTDPEAGKRLAERRAKFEAARTQRDLENRFNAEFDAKPSSPLCSLSERPPICEVSDAERRRLERRAWMQSAGAKVPVLGAAATHLRHASKALSAGRILDASRHALSAEKAGLKADDMSGFDGEIAKAIEASAPGQSELLRKPLLELASLGRHEEAKGIYTDALTYGLSDDALVAEIAQMEADEKEQRQLALEKLVKARPGRHHQFGGVKLQILKARRVKRWTYDRYPLGGTAMEAEKGHLMAVIDVKISSKDSEPMLPHLVAYSLEGSTLVKRAESELRFRKWAGYGAYVGINGDYNNDFRHRDTIRMTYGMEVPHSGKLLVFALPGCLKRVFRQYGRPATSYEALCEAPEVMQPQGLGDASVVAVIR